MDIRKLAQQVQDYVVTCRRQFHTHPELSDHEEDTIVFVKKELTAMGVEHVEVPQGGVLGFLGGTDADKTVLLRADMDALPIQELDTNGSRPKICVSQAPGVGHLCGHDAHTAVLLGAARIQAEHRDEIPGRVLLFFQRGEEFGYGMDYMMRYIQAHRIRVDGCWGLHMEPQLPVGQLGIRPGGFYAGSLSFVLTVTGRDELPPVDCGVALVNALNTARMRTVTPLEAVTCTVTVLRTEGNTCTVSGTCRYHSVPKAGTPMQKAIRSLAEGLCAAYDCQVSAKVGSPTIGVINNEDCCQIAREAVSAVIGKERIVVPDAYMGHDDFSALAAYYPSVFAALGNNEPERGITADLHNPRFEANERSFPIGVAATAAYALAFLKDDRPIRFDGVKMDYDTFLVRYEGRQPKGGAVL